MDELNALEGLLIAVRAAHFGAAIVLFGEIVFAGLAVGQRVPAPALLNAEPAASEGHRRMRRVIAASWAATVLSGALWLALVAAQMSGRPFDEALDPSNLGAVLAHTVFGQAWTVRALLAFALLGVLPSLLRESPARGPAWALGALLSGALLAGLAWAGHANAQTGADAWAHHANDAAHLIAAGAWLGGLAPLAAVLRRLGDESGAQDIAVCAGIAARFGNIALVCVGVLIATGLVNACYLLPAPSSLFATPYGRLLLAKVSLFAAMLAIAGINRSRLTPALRVTSQSTSTSRSAARALRRNAWTEQAIGAGVILLVAVLGVTAPPIGM